MTARAYCPHCVRLDWPQIPGDHDGEFFFTRCAYCNGAYYVDAYGQVKRQAQYIEWRKQRDADSASGEQ